MNPLCGCGCGQEVMSPANRYIIGHSTPRKLTLEQLAQMRRLHSRGWSTYKLAKKFGISQPRANYLTTWDTYRDRSQPSPYSARYATSEQIELGILKKKTQQNNRRELCQMQRSLREVKNYLKQAR